MNFIIFDRLTQTTNLMKAICFKISTFLLLGATLLLNNSCSDDGKDGAQGPAGTANVIYSEWISFPATYTFSSQDDRLGFFYDIQAPKITQEVLDHGIVMVYISSNGGTVFSLPYTIPTTYGVSQILSEGLLEIFTYKLNNSGGIEIPTTSKLRYVIIPGGAAAKTKTQPDYKSMSYEQVCSLHNIPM